MSTEQNRKIRFVLLGGFLGAGKTTTIAALARHYRSSGLNVAIVTNDQAADLVDTLSLRREGFDVDEVAGACFCCSFDSLIERMQTLTTKQRPDVILAEPVGSCTDLVATVIEPIAHLFAADYEISPYVVLLKPSHGQKILSGGGSGFSADAAYIFEKQLEEADVLAINRIDQLSAEQLDALDGLVRSAAPDKRIIHLSAKTGQGLDQLLSVLQQSSSVRSAMMDIDYDRYAIGEAELGWLNATYRVSAAAAVAVDDWLRELVERLQAYFVATNAEVAHCKAIASVDGAYCVANLTSNDAPVDYAAMSGVDAREFDLVINARVAVDPDLLKQAVQSTIADLAAEHRQTLTPGETRAFRPGRPVPTHRYAQSLAAH